MRVTPMMRNRLDIRFEVTEAGIAYAMQRRGIRDFALSYGEWEKIFSSNQSSVKKKLQLAMREHFEDITRAHQMCSNIEKEWKKNEARVLVWIEDLTGFLYKTPNVSIFIVPYMFAETPFKSLPLVILGKIRKGWGYTETIAHELTHIIFNQNSNLGSSMTHPFVQLIEEEIALRCGVRRSYFDYEIPQFAEWIWRAKRIKGQWDCYLRDKNNYHDIAEFIREVQRLSEGD